jgi:hypothetical protein
VVYWFFEAEGSFNGRHGKQRFELNFQKDPALMYNIRTRLGFWECHLSKKTKPILKYQVVSLDSFKSIDFII